ncbi:hypothetical protein C8Q76DRAFT_619279 [Earliella scabrosa]|nr:hypothetical protein C8Q76DRAFT_619279 [Earliella scabrosa]
MEDQLKRVVSEWKSKGFRPSDIPYGDAVYSLETDSPLVELSRTGHSEWTVCRVGSRTPAVLCYAGVFSDADDYLTGNLVIDNKKKKKTSEDESDNTLHYASYRCNYSYAFQTHSDSDFYDLQKLLEARLQMMTDFNPDNTVRRSWQSGDSEFTPSEFWMKTPMFIRHIPGERKPPFPEHLHRWVRQAEGRARKYRANPNRPAVRAVEGGRLMNIAQCTPNRLREGDAVAVSFTLKYIEGETDWYPQYLLIDIVRVMNGVPSKKSGAAYGAISGDLTRIALRDGEVVDGVLF